ncbi:MAG: hypothetical protein EXR43_02855 [Dehalococcoidia bacterium]|nr:hypothetical protein [Dehalococcoidia bacterium]
MPTKVDRDLKHDRAVRDIAAARFDFPSKEQPNYHTYVNARDPAMGVLGFDGEPVYPDIVVIEQGRNIVRMLAEVETADTVTDAEATADWAKYAELAHTFYLYVPSGYAKTAKDICKRHHIRVTGIRTWRNLVGAGTIDITEV